MKFTVSITNLEPLDCGVWEVGYKVESESINFSGVELFEEGLPKTDFELCQMTAERVRYKMIKEINRLPEL